MTDLKPPKHLNVGVLLMGTNELLDVAPVDLFGITSKAYLKSRNLPDSITSLAPSVNILYISQNYNHSYHHTQVNPCTAASALRVTRSLASHDVAPSKLDILLIPGAGPFIQITEEVRKFVQCHAKKNTVVMTVCVGVYIAAQAGILDGKKVTGTMAYMKDLKLKYPEPNWVDNKRWMSDGTIWTSGTVTNGNDMVAAFLRYTYPGVLSETVLQISDVGERGQDIPEAIAGAEHHHHAHGVSADDTVP